MAKMRVMVMKCGFATVEAKTESEAIEIAERMADSEFDWSNVDDIQVTESNIEE